MTSERTASGREHPDRHHPKKSDRHRRNRDRDDHDCDDRDQAREVTIIVNGRPKVVPKGDLTFEALVALAFPNDTPNPRIIYTITFKRGHGNKPEGTLVAGESVKAKEGMIVNVTRTDKS